MNEIFSVLVGYDKLAMAYIDPATTSYIIQIAAGAVIAIGTVVGIYRSKLKRLFKKDKTEEAAPVEKDGVQEQEVVTAEDLMKD